MPFEERVGYEGEKGKKCGVKGGEEGDKRGWGGKHEHHTLLAPSRRSCAVVGVFVDDASAHQPARLMRQYCCRQAALIRWRAHRAVAVTPAHDVATAAAAAAASAAAAATDAAAAVAATSTAASTSASAAAATTAFLRGGGGAMISKNKVESGSTLKG